jgi:hypothetical protein
MFSTAPGFPGAVFLLESADFWGKVYSLMQETLPPQTQNSAGFEPPRVRQFTVFVENRVGKLLTLVRVFEEAGNRMVALSVQNEADNALVRIICSNPDAGRIILQKNAFAFAEQDLLVVELPKRSSTPLAEICSSMLSAEININYAYPLMVRPHGPAVAVYVDDLVLASQIFIRKGFVLLGERDLSGGGGLSNEGSDSSPA